MKHTRISLALAAVLLMGAGSVHGQSSIRGTAQITLGDVLFVSAEVPASGALKGQSRAEEGELVLHVSGNRAWQLTIQGDPAVAVAGEGAGERAGAGIEWRVMSAQGADAVARDASELTVQPRVAAFGPRGRDMVVRVRYRARSGPLPEASALRYAVSAR